MARGEPTKTVGHARAGGEKALTVHCLGNGCHGAVWLTGNSKSESFLWSAVRLQAWMSSSNTGSARQVIENLP